MPNIQGSRQLLVKARNEPRAGSQLSVPEIDPKNQSTMTRVDATTECASFEYSQWIGKEAQTSCKSAHYSGTKDRNVSTVIQTRMPPIAIPSQHSLVLRLTFCLGLIMTSRSCITQSLPFMLHHSWLPILLTHFSPPLVPHIDQQARQEQVAAPPHNYLSFRLLNNDL